MAYIHWQLNERGRKVPMNHLGLPVDAKDWTERDWKDLQEALSAAIAKIARRHKRKLITHVDDKS